MKRVVINILLFAVSITFLCLVYIGLFKISVAAICVLLAFFALYALCMGLSWKSMKELKKYEQKLIHFGLNKRDFSKILWFSMSTLLPSFFCVALVSFVPLFTYEVWFITVFPCILLNCLPASSVLEEYYGLTRKKLPFLALFITFTIVFCVVGVIATSIILKQ